MPELPTKYEVSFLNHLAPCLTEADVIYLDQVLVLNTSDDWVAGYEAMRNGYAYRIWLQIARIPVWAVKEEDETTYYWTESFDEAVAFVADMLSVPIIYRESVYVPKTIPSTWYEQSGQSTDADARASRNFGTHEDIGRQRAHEHERLGADTIDSGFVGN
jgi:hypothetical protein